MFFRNKETGVTWEVTHPDHIKRCTNDASYEEVIEEIEVEEVKEEIKEKAKFKKKVTPAKAKG